MPYRNRSGRALNSNAVAALAQLYEEVLEAVDKGVARTAYQATNVAIARAPIRKIFKGGRRQFRTLSHEESVRSLMQLGLSQRDVIKSLRTSGPRREVVTRNRANSYRNTMIPLRSDLPPMRLVDTLNNRRLAHQPFERRLTSQGRYELSSGRALSEVVQPLSKGKLAPSSKNASQFTVGGGLRRSIVREDRTSPNKVKESIVAGGGSIYYARYVEFGTRYAPAQPFLRPALKKAETVLRANVEAALFRVGKPGRHT